MVVERKISLLIATKNRLESLRYTLDRTLFLIDDPHVECIICDDGSIDGTSDYIRNTYPQIKLIRNDTSLGIHASRNRLFESVTTDYAITMDDDLHFLEEVDFNSIITFFDTFPDAAVMAYRIFWGKQPPKSVHHEDQIKKVQSFGAGAHVMNMKAWTAMISLPEWFSFYGEEDYMSMELYKKGWFVYYNPDLIVHHRVDLNERKQNKKNYYRRLRMSIRSGWYLYSIFLPTKFAVKKITYSIYAQFKNRIFKGDFKTLWILVLVVKDYLGNLNNMKSDSKMSTEQFLSYQKLCPAELYWKPSE